MSDVRTGILVLTGMGLLWWLIGAFTISSPWIYAVIATGLVLFGSIAARAIAMPPQLHKLDGRLFFFSVLFEAVATLACLSLLIKSGAYGYIFPAIAMIVGLHFIGMWKASHRRDCLWLAAILCVIAAVVLPLPLSFRNQALGLSVAATLWICAVSRMGLRHN